VTEAEEVAGVSEEQDGDEESNPVEAEVMCLLREGKRVHAIKMILQVTGGKLGEAIEWINKRSAEFVQPGEFTPCPHCGKPLRTSKARQCFECGADWH
jgi:hypothetical protein